MIKYLLLFFASLSCLHADEKPPLSEFVYIQQAKTGKLTQNNEGCYDLSLQSNYIELIYFADQPERITGKENLSNFFSAWDQKKAKRPSTAFLNYTDYKALKEGGVTPDILELEDPKYDAETDTVTFKVMPLHEHEIVEGSFENVVIIYDKD